MFSIWDKIKIVGTNSQLEQIIAKVGKNKPTHIPISEKSHLLNWQNYPFIFKPVIKNLVCGLIGHASMLIFQDYYWQLIANYYKKLKFTI